MNSSTRSCRNDGISALKFEVQDYLEKQTGYCFYYVYLYLRPETFRTTLVLVSAELITTDSHL